MNRLKIVVAIMAVVLLSGTAAACTGSASAGKLMSEDEARKLADDFVRNSPTFVFDGIEKTLELTRSGAFTTKVISPDAPASGEVKGWEISFKFESRHGGYGDRAGQMLIQAITPHEVTITLVDGEIKSAMMDGKWDMVKQTLL